MVQCSLGETSLKTQLGHHLTFRKPFTLKLPLILILSLRFSFFIKLSLQSTLLSFSLPLSTHPPKPYRTAKNRNVSLECEHKEMKENPVGEIWTNYFRARTTLLHSEVTMKADSSDKLYLAFTIYLSPTLWNKLSGGNSK